jgi:hypothetical protein
MAQGFTLEQLQGMGAKPVTNPTPSSGGLTLQQIIAKQQATPAPVQQTGLLQNVGQGINDVVNKVGNTAGELGIGIIRGVGSTLNGISQNGQNIANATINKIPGLGGQQPIAQLPGMETQGTAQAIGKGAEQIGEFFIPSSLVTKTTKALEATSVVKAASALGKVGKIAGTAISHGIPEALNTAGVTMAQTGGDIGDSIRNGIIAGIVPVVGKALSVLKPVTGTIRSIATGVPKEVFQGIKENPDAYAVALQHVTENPKQPFLQLADTIKNRMVDTMGKAQQAYKQGADALAQKFTGKTFNLNPGLKSLFNTLNNDFHIAVKPSTSGNYAYEAVKTAQTPLSNKDLGVIDDLIHSVAQSKKVDLKTAVDLRQKFDEVYNNLPLSASGEKTKLHAVVQSMSNKVDEIVNKAIPELKPINQNFSQVKNIFDTFKTKFVDSNGQLKQGAEQFLSNLQNLNKGAQQQSIATLERLTGVPILDNIELLKNAQKLQGLIAPTGNRTRDILNALLIGSGVWMHNPVAAGAGFLATSPRMVGEASIKAEKAVEAIEKNAPQVLKGLVNRVTGK